MRRLILLAVLAMPALLCGQGQTGRHFQRSPRTPATAASPVTSATEASTPPRVEPLRRLRSGRAWSLYHFGRRPVTPAVGTPVVEASAERGARRTPLWGRRLRHTH